MTPTMSTYIDANQPCSALQIAQALGITRQSVYEQHGKRALRIAGWTRDSSGHATALYALGPGRDAPRPPTLTQQERSKAYHSRHKAIISARRPSKTQLRLGVWAGLA